MIRGTTTQFKFKLPYAKEELLWATMKFWQPNNPSPLLPITRRLADCDGDPTGFELCVSLTAEETERFSDKYKGKAQLRAKHKDTGVVFGCRPQIFPVYPMYDEILKDNIDELDEG
jgi:hypothetical protein